MDATLPMELGNNIQIIKSPSTGISHDVLAEAGSPDADEIIIVGQMQRIKAIMSNDIFGTEIPSLKAIDNFNKTFTSHIETFKNRFATNRHRDEYVETLECTLSKRLQKFRTVYDTHWKKIKENYIAELCKNISTDEKLKQIYDQRDSEKLSEYCKQLMTNTVERLEITEFEIPLRLQELTTILTELTTKMQKCKDAYQIYTQQFQTHIEKFKKCLMRHIEDIEIDSFVDDQTKIWEISEREAKALLTKYCNKKFKKGSESYISEVAISEYQNTLRAIFDTEWTSCLNEIKKQKNIQYLEYLLQQEEMPQECITLRKTKRPQFDNLIKCDDTHYVLQTDIDYIKKIVTLCDTDIFYIGKIYTYTTTTDSGTDEETSVITDVPLIYRAAKKANLCYGIYNKENIKTMTYSDKQISEIFAVISVENSDHKIYVFTPKDLKVFSEYVNILKCIENKSSIEESYGITLANII
jgi:hypothetical protein